MQEVIESIYVMGLNPATATMCDIKSKYRSISLRYHPDKLLSSTSVEKEAAAMELHRVQSAYQLLSNKFREKQAKLDEESKVYYANIGGGGYDGEGVSGTDVLSALRMLNSASSFRDSYISHPVVSSIPVDTTPFTTESEILRATTTSMSVLAPEYGIGVRINENVPFRRFWMEDMIRRRILNEKSTSTQNKKSSRKTKDNDAEKNKNEEMKKKAEGEGDKENEVYSDSENGEEAVDYSWGIRCRRSVPSEGMAGSEQHDTSSAAKTSSEFLWVRQSSTQYAKNWARQLRCEIMILFGIVPNNDDGDPLNKGVTQKRMNRKLFLPPCALLLCVALMCALYEWCMLRLSGYY